MNQFVLETPRLRLRPLEQSDAPAIQKAAGAREIADTMISLPHPYPAGEANRYAIRQQSERESGRSVTFTIEQKAEGEFCGLIELRDLGGIGLAWLYFRSPTQWLDANWWRWKIFEHNQKKRRAKFTVIDGKHSDPNNDQNDKPTIH